MKLIKPKAELLPWSPGIEGVYKMIELAGRTCYKSTDKITEDSAKPFVDRMIASKHLSMLEHGTVYLIGRFDSKDDLFNNEWAVRYIENPYSKTVRVPLDENRYTGPQMLCVTTNLRVLVENNRLDDLEYLCDPTEFHERRYTFRLTASIGVTRELNRHRVNSIAEQSSRYCNYSKDKFDNQVTFCIPEWWNTDEQDANDFLPLLLAGATPKEEAKDKMNFVYAMKNTETSYLILTEEYGWQPQQAREVLPLCTASEIVHTAFASDWRHFFDLRLFGKTGKPHPNMLQLATLMKEEAEKQDIWEDIMKQPSKFE